MYLVDTNVWLELLLDQERSEEARRFLDRADTIDLCLTDFTFHSIGVILFRLVKPDLFLSFTRDSLGEGTVAMVRLRPEDMEKVGDVSRRFGLDFDDAYQYVAAEKHGLALVSFDGDFDRTERGRTTPHDVVRQA